MDKRGPKIGDAASLWNFTPSPGWSKEESLILKLCLLKYGVGQWIQIQATGLLPGKLIQQLNGATQRLLGQQSLAAFSGLRVDIDRVRADNEAKVDAHRKNGLVIWTGPNPTKEMKAQWQQEAKEKYGLTPEQQQEAEAAFEELAAAHAAAAAAAAAATTVEALPPGLNILECDAQQLSTQQQQLLLCALHQRLKQLVTAAVQQHPHLAPLVTYQQQPQTGWIVQGMPCSAAAGVAAAAVAAGGSSCGVADGCDATTSNSGANQANMVVRQAGTAAGRAHKPASRLGRPSGSNSSSISKKRGRSNAAAAGDLDEQQQQQQRKRSGGSSGSKGRGRGRKGSGKQDETSGGSLLEEMMQVALDAGVAQLMEMGYSKKKAIDALQECHCDVELAVEYLAMACC